MKPDLRIYREDDTEHWDPKVVAKAEKMLGVYVFDANRVVHACSFQRTYEMWFVGSTWTNADLEDDQREALYEEVVEGDSGCDPVRYIWIDEKAVEGCEKVPIGDAEWKTLQEDKDEEGAYKALMEQAIADLTCNGYVH